MTCILLQVIILRNIPLLYNSCSIFRIESYFAVRSDFCASKIVKRIARACRWKRLGFESGIPRYARRSRGIRTLFLAQVHPWPTEQTGGMLAFDSRLWSFSGSYTRWLTDTDFPGCQLHESSSIGDAFPARCSGALWDFASRYFFPPLFAGDDFASTRFYSEMRGNNLGSVKRSAVSCARKRGRISQNFRKKRTRRSHKIFCDCSISHWKIIDILCVYIRIQSETL